MTIYTYYAVIKKTKEEDEKAYTHLVTFPDLQNVFTCGDTLQEAVFHAEDVLALMLTAFEDEQTFIPAPSNFEQLKDTVPHGSSLVLIEANTTEYRKAFPE